VTTSVKPTWRRLLAAVLCAAAAFAQVPQDASAAQLRELAAGAENHGRFGEAADCYLRLVQLDPARGEWVLCAGRNLGLAGRFNDALDLLAKKRAAFPGLLEIPALLARTQLLRVERDPGAMNPELAWADAADLATEVLRLDPDHEDARLILAQARYCQGDKQAALAAANEAVRRHPQRAGAHTLVGRMAFDDFTALKRLLPQDRPPTASDAELVGAIDRARQDAVAAFKHAADLDPDRAFARTMLGQIAAIDHDRDGALQHWGQALAIDPLARVEHGWIAEQTEPAARRAFYRDAAEHYLRRADADASKAATLRFYEGLALYAAQQWQPARELFARCRADQPEFINADYYAALCAWRLDDQDGAEELAARYAAASAVGFADVLRALAPEQRADVAGIVRFLGDRAFQHERKDRSRDLNHVIAALLDSADAWNNYAFLCRETGRFDDAFAGYQHAIEREPDSPQLWNDAAVVLQHHQPSPENFVKARSMYDHAIELADRTLADAAATALSKDRARKAREDAQKNLAELPK